MALDLDRSIYEPFERCMNELEQSENAMLYMDVTTACPDCQMQGKDSEGCQLCDGRGRAYLHDLYRRENSALREKVEQWQWYEEVRDYDPWYEHPYCTACGLASHLCKDQGSLRTKRKKCFENAIAEWEAMLSAAEIEAKNDL